MLGPVDYTIWLVVVFVELFCLACLLWKKAFKKYFTLVLYMFCSLAVDYGSYRVIETSGYRSNAYFYFFFYSDLLLAICLFFVLMNLYSHVFSEMGVAKHIRAAAMALLAGTTGISYYMIAASSTKLVTHFVAELAQNLYFVGIVLTYVLWIAMAKLHENRTRVTQLVLSMGVYVSFSAGSFALINLYLHHGIWKYYFQIISLWLPVCWTYTFMKVPEDARLATAKILAPSVASGD